MIDRSVLVGVWPDQRVCLLFVAACVALAALMFLLAVWSWLRGDCCERH